MWISCICLGRSSGELKGKSYVWFPIWAVLANPHLMGSLYHYRTQAVPLYWSAAPQFKKYCLKIKLFVLYQEMISYALSGSLRRTLITALYYTFHVFCFDCFYIHTLVKWGRNRGSFCYILTVFDRSWMYWDCLLNQGRTRVT